MTEPIRDLLLNQLGVYFQKKRILPYAANSLLNEFHYLNRKWGSIGCTTRVKSTDTGRPVFQNMCRPVKNTGPTVNLRVHPYFRYESTSKYMGRPAKYWSSRIFTVRPVFTGLLAFTGRPVKYGSMRNLHVQCTHNFIINLPLS